MCGCFGNMCTCIYCVFVLFLLCVFILYFSTFVQCILILSKFFYSPTDAQVIVLRTILKFTLKQLRHVSVQSYHLQGAQYLCLLKLHFVKMINYGTSVCGDVGAYIGRSLLVYVCCTVRKYNLHQQGPTNICTHITTHRCTIIDHFNNV